MTRRDETIYGATLATFLCLWAWTAPWWGPWLAERSPQLAWVALWLPPAFLFTGFVALVLYAIVLEYRRWRDRKRAE